MGEYYDKFVHLAMKKCTKEDYGHMWKVRRNNRAMDKLLRLEKEMMENGHHAVFLELLQHEDERVQMSAGATCLEQGIYVSEATQVLEKVMNFSSDSTFRFNAKMILQECPKKQNKG